MSRTEDIDMAKELHSSRIRGIYKDELASLPLMQNGTPILVTNSRFKQFLPPLEESERQSLEASILAYGCHTPLVVWKQTSTTYVLIDGHNRYEICSRYGISFDINIAVFKNEVAVIDWIFAQQFARRNVVPMVKSYLTGQRVLDLMAGLDVKDGGDMGKPDMDKYVEMVARMLSTTSAYVREGVKFAQLANRVEYLAGPESKQLLIKGLLDITRAHIIEMARFTDVEIMQFFRVTQDTPPKAGKYQVTQAIRTVRQERRKTKMITSLRLAPRQQVSVIVADPPWQYDYPQSTKAEIDQQYPTMELWEICKMPVESITAPDCTLFLWTPPAKLEDALKVMSAWGFKYTTHLVWKKKNGQRGKYARIRHEDVLIGEKGKPIPIQTNQMDSVFEGAPAENRHSSKPLGLMDYIDREMPDLPKAELFSRLPRIGWWSYGNEITNPDLADVTNADCNEMGGDLYELEH
jgi:N6-adenosine-specific RNA methylase IME4